MIDINKNKFVKISKIKDFFEDLKNSDCLISFSSTSIEEALFSNKRIFIYQGNKNYKHINYKFSGNNDIIYSNQNDVGEKLDLIINTYKLEDYNVLWKNDIAKNENLKDFINKNEI